MFSRGLRRALRVVRYEGRLQLRHARGCRRARKYRNQSGLRLNIGAGGQQKVGWLNIDLLAKAELSLDMREPLPFSTGSASIVYSEHFLEHLAYPKEVGRFLKECLRVLEKGGIFRVGVPDTEWPVRAYTQDDNQYFTIAKEKFHPPWCNTKMHHLNYHFRQGSEHQYAYDEETLCQVLFASGFVEVQRTEFDSLFDSVDRKIGTLYVVGRKP